MVNLMKMRDYLLIAITNIYIYMNFIPNNDQDGFNSYISQDEFFNQSGLSFVPNNDQDGFNSYISQDEFFNQRGPMGGGIGGGSVSSGIGTGSSTSGGSVSTGIGTGGTTPSPTRNTNNSNGLTAGVVSMQVGIPPSIGSPSIPYSPPIPATPGSPAIPYVPAIPSTPAYNPNTSGGMSIGVTNQGTNPNQPCPCEYTMNCWDGNCPSSVSTYTGLSSPTCPTGTTEVEPNCIVSATTGSPAIPMQPAIPSTPFVPAQPFVPAIPSSAGTPNTYTMNCWQQMCPSTLGTYSGQNSPTCPPSTQLNEPCLDSTGSSAFSGSGFSGGLWF